MIWFKFYTAWGEGVQELSDAEAGRFLKALCACAESREIPSLTGAEKVLYALASKQLKQDTERSAEISRTRAEAGRIGGLSSGKQIQANGSKTSNCKQIEAKQANANKCSIKNTELRTKNSEVKLFEETEVSAPEKPKLTPDDHDFWKVFGKNAELAETFYRVTGIDPTPDFGRWQKDLKAFDQAGITPLLMQKAIQKMRKDGITIFAPSSVYKVARSMQGQPQMNKNPESFNSVTDFYNAIMGGDYRQTEIEGSFK